MLRTIFLRLVTASFLASLVLTTGCSSSSGSSAPGDGDDASVADSAPKLDTAPGDTSTTDGKTDSSCAAPKTSCSGTCTDLAIDANNCGKCGNKCAGAGVCVGGACKTTCTGDTVACDGVCVDLLKDPDHCGDCTTKCGKDDSGTPKLCVDAICKLDCSTKTDCGIDTCVDLKSDARNCGVCGKVCSTGFDCEGGTCTCLAGTTACSGVCKNLKTDSSNCGACGKVCDFLSTCTGGACVCNTGYTSCSGTCKNLTNDDNNCGACGTTCDVASGKKCIGSKCVLDCGTTGTDCSGVCKYLQYDAANCGACGKTCGAGQYCSSGVCKCASGLSDCSGVCKDLKTDGANCGFCGLPCTGGKVCSGGSCSASCGTGYTACGASCLDTQNDPNNCGTCGHVCTSGICGAGACLTAPKCSSGPFKVLFFGPLLTGEQKFLPVGSVVTVADEGMWRAMTTSDFAKYNLIVFGEGGFCPPATSWQAIFDTRTTWSAATVGRIVMTQQDPVLHSSVSAGAGVFLKAALQWAASGPGTGLYVANECGARNYDFMSPFGTFASTSVTGENVHIVVPSHGTMIGSTDTSLSTWGNSYHGNTTSFPASFTLIANGSGGENLILARDKLCGP